MKTLEIGDKLKGYQDGKLARRVTVIVDGIIAREDLSLSARRMWKKALKQDFDDVFNGIIWYCQGNKRTKQFWDWNCDRFIVGHLKEPFGGDDESTRPRAMLFAKRAHGMGWYGINWNYDLVVGRRKVQ